jgi:hypothetical protein
MNPDQSAPSITPSEVFNFLPAYTHRIAHAANRWAYMEYYFNSDTKPAVGACLTSQMYTLNSKLNALLSLLKLRKADQTLIDMVNKFAAQSRDALEARNRLVHDIWLNDNYAPDQMGKMRITADRVLRFIIEPVPVEKLDADVMTIEHRRAQAGTILEAVKAALPVLPEMSLTELHPITETPSQ